MVPTQAGYKLLIYINEIFDITERMKAMSDPSDTIQGTLHIAIPAHLALSRLCLALKKFQEAAPYVNIVVSNYHSISIIHKMVYDGEVDVAFTEDYTRSDSDLEVTTLECSRLCLIAGPLMDLSSINVSQPGKPLGCGIVLNQKDAVYRKLFEDYLQVRQITPTSITEFWGIEVVKRFVQLGGGIALLPHAAIEGELERNELIEIRPLEPFPSIYINMTVLKSKWESPQLHLFKKIVNCYFKSQYPAIDEVMKKAAVNRV